MFFAPSVRRLWLVALVLLAAACSSSTPPGSAGRTGEPAYARRVAALPEVPDGAAVATFAGGCFWCVEAAFDAVPGVLSTTSGYTGGKLPQPTYDAVSTGTSGHLEAVRVVFDPARVSYAQLLEVFWRNVDPTDARGQFCDKGAPYRAAIFFHTPDQQAAAEASLAALDRQRPFRGAIVTRLLPADRFWPAEVEHQDFHLRNPLRYRYYRTLCGRDARLRALWGPPPQ